MTSLSLKFQTGYNPKESQFQKEIYLLNEKVANARDKYLADKLDEEDYKEIKNSQNIK